MSRVGVRALWAFASLVGAVSACEGRDIIVFSPALAGSGGLGGAAGSGGVAAAGSGGSAGGGAGDAGAAASGGAAGAPTCQSTSDCDPSWYCAKQSCADSAGYCLPRPISDDSQFAPVCGCEDGITYWNDTLRQVYGISASTPGACQLTALGCNGDIECGTNGTCSHQLPDPSFCGMPGKGQCWVIPNDCGSADDRQSWLPCSPPPSGGAPPPPPQCMTTCQALQAGWPYFRRPKDFHCQ